MRRPRSASTALLAVAALAAGCDSGDSESTELAAALPGDPSIVAYIDLEAAREALELPDDADPADFDALEGLEDGAPEALLVDAAHNALPHVAESFAQTFQADATTEAIDHTQVSAAASSFGPDGRVAVLQTDQSFDEIAEALEAAGFEREGDVLAGESADPEPVLPYVADLGDGRIVVAADQGQAEEAVAGDGGEPGEAVALLDELDTPQREAASVDLEDSCVTGFALGGEPGGSEIELAVRVDGEADSERVPSELELASVDEPAPVGEVEVDGDLVTAIARSESTEADLSTVFATGALTPTTVYDC